MTITIGLAMVLVVFLSLSADQPSLAREYGHLLASFGLFLGLAFVSGYAFIATLKRPPWLWPAQAATWVAIGGIAWFYWPK